MGFRLIGALMFAWITAGCNMTQPNPAPVVESGHPSSGENRSTGSLLRLGLKQYDDGHYKRAALTLQQALESNLSPAERINAHKHLAFIYCTSNRVAQCRNEFGKAIKVDPRFDLAPAEAGHPQWGPVFRSVKTRQPTAS